MKIKEVCERTGLTDKTIRYYIREGLIFPKYDENYTGRKNFNFEECDINRLQCVATFRKYGFSVNSIKMLFNNEQNVQAVFNEHLAKSKENKLSSEKIYNRLNEISSCDFSTAEELCSLLAQSEYIPSEVPSNDNKTPYRLLYSKNKRARNMLALLVIIITVLLSVVIAFVCNAFYQATSSSVIDINKGFVGVRIVQTNDKNYSTVQGTELINDIFVDVDYIESSADFESVTLTKDGDVNVINATLNSDMKYIKVYPIYESRHYGDTILYNGTCWLAIDNSKGIELESKQVYKSKHGKYKYDIKVNNMSDTDRI